MFKMFKGILIVLILILAWYGNRQYQHEKFIQEAKEVHQIELQQQNKIVEHKKIKINKPISRPKDIQETPKYKCDGRQHCSQMQSYDEAKFFLDNCPNTRMDGDYDGIPCERQFNRYR